MTLVFLGPTLPEQRSRLELAADTISADPFTMNLDVTGQFMRTQVAWLGCQHPHRRLVELQQALESALRLSCPDHPEFAKGMHAYCPHVTLYRHVSDNRIAEKIDVIRWPVSSFFLIESRSTRRPVYRIVNSWKLTA